jgi:hypothetical protein
MMIAWPSPQPFPNHGNDDQQAHGHDRPPANPIDTHAASEAVAEFNMKRFAGVSTRFLMSSRSAFERGEVAQTLIDVCAVFFAFLFISVCGVGIAAAFFILFFDWL